MLNKYTQTLDLQSYDVYHECNPNIPMFFDIQGIKGKTFGYGKHSFSIAIMDPNQMDVMDPKLQDVYIKNNSNILFELVDSSNNVIYSGLSNLEHVDGSSYVYFYIEEDLKNTYDAILDGKAKLIVVGELEGPNLPQRYKNSYNIRTQIPFYVRKNQPNVSPIIFKEKPVARVSESIERARSNGIPFDQIPSFGLYHVHEFDKLDTISGRVKYIDIEYAESSSLDIYNAYKPIGTIEVNNNTELLTNHISKSTSVPYASSLAFGSSEALTDEHIGYFDKSYKLNYWNGSVQQANRSRTIDTTNKKLHLSGMNAIHSLVRYSQEGETFKLKLDVSGSASYYILESKDSASLIPNDDKFYMNQFGDATNETLRNNINVVYQKNYRNFEPASRTGPYIEENIDSSLDGNYDEITFTIDSASFFAIRLESRFTNTSASFSNVSIKPSPQSGVNPPTFIYKMLAPKVNIAYDIIHYKYRFLNSNREVVKDYEYYPIEDLTLDTNIVTQHPQEVFHRRNNTPAFKFRSTVTGLNVQGATPSSAIGISSETVPSASIAVTSKIGIQPANTAAAIFAAAYAGDSGSTIPSIGLLSHGRTTAGNSLASASSYAAVFGGSTGAGDVLFQQNVGIGDFSYSSEQHPDTALHVKGDISASGNLHIDGRLTAAEYHTYITSASIIFASGSTLFGDSSDDSHKFVGDITSSGDISSSGIIYGNDIITDKIQGPLDPDVQITLTTGGLGFNTNASDTYTFNEGEIDADWRYIDANNDVLIFGDAGLARVGIGDTSPVSKLDVGGDLNVQSHITASGNISSSGELQASELHLVKHNASSNEKLFTIEGALQNERFSVDEDGDIQSSGGATIGGSITGSTGLLIYGPITASGNITSSGDLLKTKFVQMTNSSSVIDTFNTGSFRSAKYVLQVTSASKYQVSEMLVLHNDGTALNTEYAQINSGLNLVDFTTDVGDSNTRLIASSSFISCSVRYDRTIIPT